MSDRNRLIVITIIIIIILLLLCHKYKKIKCTSGKYLNNGKCETCPMGFYCPDGTAIICPSNYTSPKGSETINSCIRILEDSDQPNLIDFNIPNYPSYPGVPTQPGVPSYPGVPTQPGVPSYPGVPTQPGITTCPAGQYLNNGVCVLCPAGSYCPNGTAITCPINSTSAAGSALLSDCTCINGYIKNADGVCEQCKCEQGNFVNNNRCVTCPTGYYCPIDSDPVRCMDNSTSSASSTDISGCICNKGYYLNNGVCTICPVGSYCTNGVKTGCPDSKTSKLGSGAASNCICREGHYFNNGLCTICPVGSYCPIGTEVAISCGDNESTSSNKISTQLMCQCRAGYYGVHNNCTICPANSYCPYGSTYQLMCPENSTSDQGSKFIDKCKCIIGYYKDGTRCIICPAGSRCVNDGMAPCPSDYISTSGQSECTACKPGQMSNSTNTTCLTKYYMGVTYSSYTGDVASNTNGVFITHKRAIDTEVYPLILTDYSEGFRIDELHNMDTEITYNLTYILYNDKNQVTVEDVNFGNGSLTLNSPLVIYRTAGNPNRLILKPELNAKIAHFYNMDDRGNIRGETYKFNATKTDEFDRRLTNYEQKYSIIKYIDLDLNLQNYSKSGGYNAIHLIIKMGAFLSTRLDTYILIDPSENLNGILRINFYMSSPFNIDANLNTNSIPF